MIPENDSNLWRFDGNICDHGICPGDCDKCNRNLPFGETEKSCFNCEHSDEYANGKTVCWLLSDNELLYITDEIRPCEAYKPKEKR